MSHLVTILTGGEPLLRRDILEIVRRAAERGLWVVVGTNGVSITENLARRLAEADPEDLRLGWGTTDAARRILMRRGSGFSPGPAPTFGVERPGRDVAAVIEAAAVTPVTACRAVARSAKAGDDGRNR